MSKCECCKEENSDLITYKGYKMCPACYMGYVRKVKVCENNAKYETEIDQLKQQLESREDSDSSTMKYLNKLRDENIKLKKELSRYKSYKTDDERIKDLTNLYSQYAEESKKLQQQFAEKEEEIERLNHKLNVEETCLIRNYKDMLEQLKQSQTQLAIQELEKVKDFSFKYTMLGIEVVAILNYIDQQINELKDDKKTR